MVGKRRLTIWVDCENNLNNKPLGNIPSECSFSALLPSNIILLFSQALLPLLFTQWFIICFPCFDTLKYWFLIQYCFRICITYWVTARTSNQIPNHITSATNYLISSKERVVLNNKRDTKFEGIRSIWNSIFRSSMNASRELWLFQKTIVNKRRDRTWIYLNDAINCNSLYQAQQSVRSFTWRTISFKVNVSQCYIFWSF
jgi:hypothetical protein